MPRKITKTIAILLSFLFLLQQTGFAQVAGQIDIAGHLARFHQSLTTDKFRPLHLRYLEYIPQDNSFKLLIDKGNQSSVILSPKGEESNIVNKQLESTSKTLFKYFLIGLTLPNESFWVNLRPDSPDNIIDDSLAKTDIGRIMLEADLELKKDTASATSPDTKEGRVYWDKLYKKAGELFGSENITIPTLTRPWIVPDEVIVRESQDSAYIYKATLKVMLEEDYLKRSEDGRHSEGRRPEESAFRFFVAKNAPQNDERLKELNKYSTELIKELIIPKLTLSINTSKKYAELRQVYYSLILAQWFKTRQGLSPEKAISSVKGTVPALIDSKDLTNLTATKPYSKETYFNQYKDSFARGEYNFQEPVYTMGGKVIRSYFSGGIQAVSLTATGISPASASSSIITSSHNTGFVATLTLDGLQVRSSNWQEQATSSPIVSSAAIEAAGKEIIPFNMLVWPQSIEDQDEVKVTVRGEVSTWKDDIDQAFNDFITKNLNSSWSSGFRILKDYMVWSKPLSVKDIGKNYPKLTNRQREKVVEELSYEKIRAQIYALSLLLSFKEDILTTKDVTSEMMADTLSNIEQKLDELKIPAADPLREALARVSVVFKLRHNLNISFVYYLLTRVNAVGLQKILNEVNSGVDINVLQERLSRDMAVARDEARGLAKNVFNRLGWVQQDNKDSTFVEFLTSIVNTQGNLQDLDIVCSTQDLNKLKGWLLRREIGLMYYSHLQDKPSGTGQPSFYRVIQNLPEEITLYQIERMNGSEGDDWIRKEALKCWLFGFIREVFGDNETLQDKYSLEIHSIVDQASFVGYSDQAMLPAVSSMDELVKETYYIQMGSRNPSSFPGKIEYLKWIVEKSNKKAKELRTAQEEKINKAPVVNYYLTADGRSIEVTNQEMIEILKGKKDVENNGRPRSSTLLWVSYLDEESSVSPRIVNIFGPPTLKDPGVRSGYRERRHVDMARRLPPLTSYYTGSIDSAGAYTVSLSMAMKDISGAEVLAHNSLPAFMRKAREVLTNIASLITNVNNVDLVIAIDGNTKLSVKEAGNKAVRLSDLARLGIASPSAFSILTMASSRMDQDGSLSNQVLQDIDVQINKLEGITGKGFGNVKKPLFVSVRSSGEVSLPGAMDTVLNIGLNDVTIKGLVDMGGERFAYDTYSRFIQMYAVKVLGLNNQDFNQKQEELFPGRDKNKLTAEELKATAQVFKEIVKEKTGKDFPQDIKVQLNSAIAAVFKSSDSDNARMAKRIAGVPDELGTAVVVQAMVFGNLNSRSGTGVVFSRNHLTGEKGLSGDFMWGAQGEDVVGGKVTPQGLDTLKESMPEVYKELEEICARLEREHKSMQDLEITIEDGRLWTLQDRDNEGSAEAAARIYLDMAKEGLLTKEEALQKADENIENISPEVDHSDPSVMQKLIAQGIKCSPGVITGPVVFSPESVSRLAAQGYSKVILSKEYFGSDDYSVLARGDVGGLMVSEGGDKSHGALVSRSARIPAVLGVGKRSGNSLGIGERQIKEGEILTIDGGLGEVFLGEVKAAKPQEKIARLMALRQEVEKLPASSPAASSPMGKTEVVFTQKKSAEEFIDKLKSSALWGIYPNSDAIFLKLGIKPGDNIVDIGFRSSIRGLVAMAQGAHYIGFDLYPDETISIAERLAEKGHEGYDIKGSAQFRNSEFSSGIKSTSGGIKDHTQDLVLMLTGVLGDPSPDSNPQEVLNEALRVARHKGRLVISSEPWFSKTEKARTSNVIEKVLSSAEWKDKVKLNELANKGEIIYEVLFSNGNKMTSSISANLANKAVSSPAVSSPIASPSALAQQKRPWVTPLDITPQYAKNNVLAADISIIKSAILDRVDSYLAVGKNEEAKVLIEKVKILDRIKNIGDLLEAKSLADKVATELSIPIPASSPVSKTYDKPEKVILESLPEGELTFKPFADVMLYEQIPTADNKLVLDSKGNPVEWLLSEGFQKGKSYWYMGPIVIIHGQTVNGIMYIGDKPAHEVINKLAEKYNLKKILVASCNPDSGSLGKTTIPVIFSTGIVEHNMSGITAFGQWQASEGKTMEDLLRFNWTTPGNKVDATSSPDSTLEPVLDKTGGIDFRFIPIIAQAMTNLSSGFSLTNDVKLKLNRVNLGEEWSQIDRLASSSISPSPERIKEYIQAACVQNKLQQKDIEKIILCIANTLRCDEESCSKSEPTLMDILIILESQKTSQQLNKAFLGIPA